MDATRTYPKLRFPIDIRVENAINPPALVISCPLGITAEPLVLHAALAPVLESFDGSNSVEVILSKFSALGLSSPLLTELIELLDTKLFLAGNRFLLAEKKVRDQFALAVERPAYLAGHGYPASAETLGTLIDSLLTLKHSPPAEIPLSCLVSPHIDYTRGGTCYGKTYPVLASEQHDLYLLMGTAHQYSKLLFHLCAKDFASPLGNLECDRDFMHALASGYGVDRSFADQYLHRREHSLELQVPFLQRVQSAPKIAPVLVGSFHPFLRSGKRPEEFELYEAFATALAATLASYRASGKRCCIIAGVDMAHIGRHFGDKEALTPESLREIEERDTTYLRALCSHDKKMLFEHVAEDLDARRICGFPTMYTVLDVFDRLAIKMSGTVIHYAQAVDYERDCAVTFAGLTLR